jgi:hypothetical protein
VLAESSTLRALAAAVETVPARRVPQVVDLDCPLPKGVAVFSYIEDDGSWEETGLGVAECLVMLASIDARHLAHLRTEQESRGRELAEADGLGDPDLTFPGLLAAQLFRVVRAAERRFGDALAWFRLPAEAELRERLDAHLPVRNPGRDDVLLHGDLHPGNLVPISGKATAMLDWELAAVGDPLYDVAVFMERSRLNPHERCEFRETWAKKMSGLLGAWSPRELRQYVAAERIRSAYTDLLRTVAGGVNGARQPRVRAYPALERGLTALAALDPTAHVRAPSEADFESAMARFGATSRGSGLRQPGVGAIEEGDELAEIVDLVYSAGPA